MTLNIQSNEIIFKIKQSAMDGNNQPSIRNNDLSKQEVKEDAKVCIDKGGKKIEVISNEYCVIIYLCRVITN